MATKKKNLNFSNNDKGNILLISDSEKINTYLIKYLVPYGYKIIIANDGLVALKKIRTLKVDLIIVRLKLPTIYGFQLIMRLTDIKKKIPIIMIEEKDKTKQEFFLEICASYSVSKAREDKIKEIIDIIAP